MPRTNAPRFSGAKLGDLRSRRKLSRQVLCSKVRPDLSIATLKRWEDGHTAPGADDLLRLAHALGVDVDELVAP
ncbi:MAG: helix-turn-helix transcriptional regulator [Trebonia sp.]